MKVESTTRICVPLCASDLNALEALAVRTSISNQLVEFRLDCLSPNQLNQFLSFGKELVSKLHCNVIITFRDPRQGGLNSWTIDDRRRFWKSQLANGTTLFDLEYDLVREVMADQTASIDWSRVICSHHDFDSMPDNLETIYESLASTPAGIVKIAATATDVVDCLPIFDLLDRAREENRELIALAMGDCGIATRVLGPSRGSYLTYAAHETSEGTAPGQVTVRDLKSVYRIHEIDRASVVTGLVGKPATHSVSPHMHNAALASERINGVYIPFEVSDLAAFFKRMVHPATRELDWNLTGLSITAPHKSKVMNFLDWIEPKASEIGAVNTVVVKDNKLYGYNTDAEGFLKPLREKLHTITNSRIAVIGAGGAARAVVWSLVNSGAKVILYVRDQMKAQSLSNDFDVDCRNLSGASFKGYDAVVNTTPLGTYGALISQAPANSSQLEGANLVYDLVYNPLETQLLREARLARCETLGGLGMLVSQAIIQFELWTGKNISHSIMNDAALTQLTS